MKISPTLIDLIISSAAVSKPKSMSLGAYIAREYKEAVDNPFECPLVRRLIKRGA